MSARSAEFNARQKMGKKSSFNSLAASLHPSSAAPLVSFEPLPMTAKSFVRRAVLVAAQPSWKNYFLILLVAGLACLPLNGATSTNGYEFQKSMPKPGSIQWDINHAIIKERQEQHRKRLAIPNAAGTNVPRASTAYLVNGRKMAPAPAPVPADESEMFLKPLLFAAALALTGLLLAGRFAPQVLADINQRFNPWALPPVVGRDSSANVRAEEEAFGKFLTTFRSGQSATPEARSQGKAGLANEFFARTKQRLVAQRKLLHDIVRESRDPARKIMLTNLCFEMGVLKGEAGFPEALPVWQVASTLEGLLKQLTGKIRNVTPS